MNKLGVLDLFSGIGGFSLGLERTGGFETVAFCEIEDFPRRVLAKHWPGVPCYEDVRELTGKRLAADGIAADVITGGFPCQDISLAGSQQGMGAETRSGLWSEIVRLVGELRPRYILVENVANLLAGPSERPGGWFGRVLGDLAECGYDAEWRMLPASQFGAPHKRPRVWLVAYPSGVRQPLPWRFHNAIDKAKEAYREANPFIEFLSRKSMPFVCRRHDGVPNGVDRLSALGNAVVPQIPEMIGRAILAAEAEALTDA